MPADRRRQGLTFDQAGQGCGRRRDAASVIALTEARRQILLDDAVGSDVRNGAFQAVTWLDADATVVLGHQQQHAVVHALAADLPLVEHALGVLLDRFRLRGRHDQDLQLRALALLQGQRLLLELLDLPRIQGAGDVDHRRAQRRDGSQLLRQQRRRQQQQRHHPHHSQSHSPHCQLLGDARRSSINAGFCQALSLRDNASYRERVCPKRSHGWLGRLRGLAPSPHPTAFPDGRAACSRLKRSVGVVRRSC
ncbi:hypothetical protein CKU38_00893 [Xanthomonas citri pv. fuscans]|nr:hypothetical protein CKU38_00893 [Xanthomonas citri pv. fuscans]